MIFFYFQSYALEQRSIMVLKLCLFSENYFLVKIFVFFGHTYLCVFFKFMSIFGNKLLFDPILQREGGKDLHFRYTTHITKASRVWQAIEGADLFSTSYSRKMASGSLFFTKSAILPIFDPMLQREGGKRSALPLYHTYHKNLTSVASYLGCRSF